MKNFCVVLFIVWFAGPACGSKNGGGGGGGGGGTMPSPTIASINPTSGTAAGGTAVTISGTGFSGTTTASVGGVGLTNVTVVSANTITGTTGQTSTAGAVSLSVTTAGGQTTSLSSAFTYVAVLRAMINGTTNGSITIIHNTPTTFSAAQSSTTSPYTINSYSWNCGQDPAVYNSTQIVAPVVVCQPPNTTISPVFSYRHCANASNRQPCTSGSGTNGMRTYTMTLTVTDTQGNSNSTNYNVTVTNQY